MMVPLKMGMVGGGLDALVGAWHRRAVAIDGGIEATFRPDDWPAALPSKPARESSTPRSG